MIRLAVARGVNPSDIRHLAWLMEQAVVSVCETSAEFWQDRRLGQRADELAHAYIEGLSAGVGIEPAPGIPGQVAQPASAPAEVADAVADSAERYPAAAGLGSWVGELIQRHEAGGDREHWDATSMDGRLAAVQAAVEAVATEIGQWYGTASGQNLDSQALESWLNARGVRNPGGAQEVAPPFPVIPAGPVEQEQLAGPRLVGASFRSGSGIRRRTRSRR